MIPCYRIDLLDSRLRPRRSPSWEDVRGVVWVWVGACVLYLVWGVW